MDNQYLVCRGYKSPYMKGMSFYYYHPACWDAKERSVEKENCMTGKEVLFSTLSTEQTPLAYGFARLIPASEVAPKAACCYYACPEQE